MATNLTSHLPARARRRGSGTRSRGRRRAAITSSSVASTWRAPAAPPSGGTSATSSTSQLGGVVVDQPGARRPRRCASSAAASAAGAGRCGRRMRWGRSSISSRMPWKSPSAASRPCATTSTREPNRSTSSSTWRRDDHAAALGAEAVEDVDQPQPLAGVEAVERLVGDDDRRPVDQRLRDLDPLAHALRVAVDRAAVVGVHLDRRRARRVPRASGSSTPCSTAGEPHEVERRASAGTSPPAAGTRPT